MKFLGNRGFVIVLAILAVALVSKNLLWPVIRRSFGTRGSTKSAPANVPSPAPAATSPEAAKAGPATPASQPAVRHALDKVASLVTPAAKAVPQAPMDVHSMRASSPAWIANPLRDPFFVRAGIKDGRSARELLTLTGTLQQTASTLAVLNNRVLAAGDSILGFKLEAVENDRVWVTGPNGRESVEFKYIVELAPKEPAQAEPPQLPKSDNSLGSIQN